MAGTTGLVVAVLGACSVAVVAVLARARVEIARINSRSAGSKR
ncbi:hypothetical protein ACGFR8_07735 [Streptomyces brevispora]